MFFAYRFAWVVIAALIVVGCEQAEKTRLSGEHRQLLESLSKDDVGVGRVSSSLVLSLKLGESAVPILVKQLDSSNDIEKRRRISWALAYAGGDSSISALKRYADESGDKNAKAPLLFALPSGSRTDTLAVFAIESLKGEHIGSDWFPIVQAAYSLGVLREKGAELELKRTAEKHEGSASVAAASALLWMSGINVATNVSSKSEDDDLIQAALTFPLGGFVRFAKLCETVPKKRTWEKHGANWKITDGCDENDSKTPDLFLSSYRSTDGERALLAVGYIAGPLDGEGFNYVFRKRNGVWVVVGIQPTWVS